MGVFFWYGGGIVETRLRNLQEFICIGVFFQIGITTRFSKLWANIENWRSRIPQHYFDMFCFAILKESHHICSKFWTNMEQCKQSNIKIGCQIWNVFLPPGMETTILEVVSEPQWRSKWLIIRATRALEMAASNLQGFPNWLLDHALGPQWPSKVELEITVRKDASIRLAFWISSTLLRAWMCTNSRYYIYYIHQRWSVWRGAPVPTQRKEGASA